MGWIASALIILGIWLVGDKSIWGFIFGAAGNFLWAYVGLKRWKQYDIVFISIIGGILYLVGLIKWLG